MDRLILGIDAGNHKAKTAGIHGVDSYKTNICNWFKRDVMETFGADDMEFTIGSRRGYAGTIAEHEDEFGNGTTYGDSKAHEDTKIRVLLAAHRYIERYCPGEERIWIVTGQPISRHDETEKAKIFRLLQGKHEFEVNGIKRAITIEDVKVVGEGAGGYWSNPIMGMQRIIDVGSGTCNMVSISDKRFIHKSSTTMDTGMETLKNKEDIQGMARGIIQRAKKLKWKETDNVLVCGGVSNQIAPFIKSVYPNAEVIIPKLKRQHDTLTVQPIYANAIGFYNLGRGIYQ